MTEKPRPTELKVPIGPDRRIEEHRNLFCAQYDGCLDEAVKQGWNGWTCAQCNLFAVAPAPRLADYAERRIA